MGLNKVRTVSQARRASIAHNEIAFANHHIRRLLGSRTVDSLLEGDPANKEKCVLKQPT